LLDGSNLERKDYRRILKASFRDEIVHAGDLAMDWRLSSLGLVLDGMSFLSPLGLPTLGIPWYSYQSFAVQAFLVLVGLFLTLLGLIKRGSISVSSSEVLMLACGFLVFLALFEFGSTAMASAPFGDRCAEIGDPVSCSMMSNVKLLELLFWPAVLTPGLTLFGTALAARQAARGTSGSTPSSL